MIIERMFESSAPLLERTRSHPSPVAGCPRPDQESAEMHPVAALTLALAAARHGPGPVRLAALAREAGVDMFTRIHDELPAKEQAKLRNAAESLARTGVSAVLLGSADYPPRL